MALTPAELALLSRHSIQEPLVGGGGVDSGASLPGTVTEDLLFWNSTDDTLWIGKSGVWIDVSNADGFGGFSLTEDVISTTDATITTIATIPINDDTVHTFETFFSGRQTNAAGRGLYIRRAAVYREAGGPATLQGTVNTEFTRESSAGWNVFMTVSGNDLLLQVKGLAAQDINWKSGYHMTEVT